MTIRGVAVGAVIALASVRLVQSLLFGVTTHDLTTFVGGPLVLTAVALVACLIPAARAASTDPMVTLRSD